MTADMTPRRTLRFRLALVAGKLASLALRITGRAGGQMPGVVAEAVCPDFLARMPKPAKTVFVTGTNGKTTTSNLLDDILIANGFDLITNRNGGNIITGIESSLIRESTLSGAPRKDTACMELDELSCRRVLGPMPPDVLLVCNLYRDNFTRNADPDYIFGVIDAAAPADTHLILNADDLISCRVAPQAAHRTYFSIDRLPDDLPGPEGIVCDLTACPVCGGALSYDWCHLRHLGRAHCEGCGFTNPAPDYLVTRVDRAAGTFTLRELCHEGEPECTYQMGAYSITNLYNLVAATVTARELGVSAADLERTFASGAVAITSARFSERTVAGTRLVNIAAKGENSTATSATLATVCREPGDKCVALMLSDYYLATSKTRTEFTGWYYQADFENLAAADVKQVIIQGATADDLLLRLLMAGIPEERIHVVESVEEAAEAVRLDEVGSVFCAYDIFNGPQAEDFRDRVSKRLEAVGESGSAA
ncbi:MAG: MurT ligase domain-containing protein [Collinsella sp.]|nr:MurT ligase domain-containing protein [Collinsella sp.]